MNRENILLIFEQFIITRERRDLKDGAGTRSPEWVASRGREILQATASKIFVT